MLWLSMANRRKIDRAERTRAALGRARSAVSIALRGLAAVTAMGAASLGGYAGFVFLTESPRFAIERIEVSGASRVPEAELVRLAGISTGRNLFLFDTAAAQAQLSLHPWIREVRVDRDFPQGIAVEVLEREPAALVEVESLYLVDAEGEVFKRHVPGDPADLPVVTGLPRDVWAERPDEARESLLEALALVAAWEDGPLGERAPVSEVHLDPAEGMTLYAGDRDFAVKLGHEEIAAKLSRLQRVLAEADARGQALRLVRLDNRTRPGWIAARPKEALQ